MDGQGFRLAARTASSCRALAMEIVPGQPGALEGECAGGEVMESFTWMSPSAPVEGKEVLEQHGVAPSPRHLHLGGKIEENHGAKEKVAVL